MMAGSSPHRLEIAFTPSERSDISAAAEKPHDSMFGAKAQSPHELKGIPKNRPAGCLNVHTPVPTAMKVKISLVMTPENLRHYTATNRKGETVSAKVYDCGHGFHLFWQKVLAKWPKAFSA